MKSDLRPFFSIAIPVYGYKGMGIEFLLHNLSIIKKQTFTDYEVVISDHSVDDAIENFMTEYKGSVNMNIIYTRCDSGRGFISPNLNNAIINSSGKWIKILFQDDFLYNRDSLSLIYDAITKSPIEFEWLINSFCHSNTGHDFYRYMTPRYNDNIYKGVNTIGNPSNIAIKNNNPILFNENLNWLVDCEYYYRTYLKCGHPIILPDTVVVNRTHGQGLSDTIDESTKNNEHRLMLEKYA